MNQPKFHKLYFPGLMTLAALPVIFICYLTEHGVFRKYQEITLAWMNKTDLNRHNSRFGRKFDIETFRKYNVIEISGNLKEDDIKFVQLRQMHQQLIAKNDTIDGIKVIFGDRSTYDELVTVLDIGLHAKDDGLFLAPTGTEIFIGHVDISRVRLLPK